VARSEAGGTTLYLIDDLNPTGFAQVVDEISGGTVAGTYTLGPQRASQTRWTGGVPTTSFYAHDALGSVRLLTSSTGVVTDTYTHGGFGNPLVLTGTTPNPYRFVGEQLDSTMGLINLRARWYGPLAGRFATADKFEGVLGQPQTLHKYTYANNDPVNFTDPSGNAVFLEAGLLFEFDVQAATLLLETGVLLATTLRGPVECAVKLTACLNLRYYRQRNFPDCGGCWRECVAIDGDWPSRCPPAC
jgi:RHS repeat-associated protein